MPQVFIGLGANLGDGPRNLLAAWRRLNEQPGLKTRRLSNPYRTEPVGIETTNWFTNAVGELACSLAPAALLDLLLAIEVDFGRNRSLGRDRPMDLDILYFGELLINDPNLTVPHPELANRAFVLAPLVELAPDRPHPVLGLTSRQLYALCPGREGLVQQEWPKWPETV